MSPSQTEAEWLGNLAHSVTPKTVIICAYELCKEEGESGKDEQRESNKG